MGGLACSLFGGASRDVVGGVGRAWFPRSVVGGVALSVVVYSVVAWRGDVVAECRCGVDYSSVYGDYGGVRVDSAHLDDLVGFGGAQRVTSFVDTWWVLGGVEWYGSLV